MGGLLAQERHGQSCLCEHGRRSSSHTSVSLCRKSSPSTATSLCSPGEGSLSPAAWPRSRGRGVRRGCALGMTAQGWPTSENRLALLVTSKTKPGPFGAGRDAAAFLGQDGSSWPTGQRWVCLKVFQFGFSSALVADGSD